MTKRKISTKNNVSALLEYAGWMGVTLVVGSYGLLATGIIPTPTVFYHSLVFAGSLAVAVLSYTRHDYQPAVLNTLFCILAFIAIIRILLA